MSSCTAFLAEDPDGAILLSEYFRDEDDVENAMYSVYAPLNSNALFGRYMPIYDVGTDLVGAKNNADYPKPLLYHTVNAQSFWIDNTSGTTWLGLWQGVLKANFILSNIDNVEDIDETYYKQAVAEARCMRAFYYYYLARMWGDLPIITWYVNSLTYDGTADMDRAPVDRVYKELIIPDLIYASENAPTAQVMTGRATKWLAKTLLAEAYMTLAGYRRDSKTGVIAQGDQDYWKEALRVIKEVVGETANGEGTSCPHALLQATNADDNPYARIWDDEFTQESILEVGAYAMSGVGNVLTNEAFSQTTGGNFWGANANINEDVYGEEMETMNFQVYHQFPRQTSNGLFIPTAELYHLFESDDDLRKWGILTEYTDYEGEILEFTYYCAPTFRKYVDMDVKTNKPGTDSSYGDVNFVLYRYADALLIFAEAENEVNGVTEAGLSALNQIRVRAKLRSLTTTDTPTKEAFRRAVKQERAIELHAEVKRRFDLIRWNELVSATADYDTYYVPGDNDNDITYTDTSGKTQSLSLVTAVCYTANKEPSPAPEKVYLMPIPAGDIAKSGWYQNAGYN